jgi:hypothetical protein
MLLAKKLSNLTPNVLSTVSFKLSPTNLNTE